MRRFFEYLTGIPIGDWLIWSLSIVCLALFGWAIGKLFMLILRFTLCP